MLLYFFDSFFLKRRIADQVKTPTPNVNLLDENPYISQNHTIQEQQEIFTVGKHNHKLTIFGRRKTKRFYQSHNPQLNTHGSGRRVVSNKSDV